MKTKAWFLFLCLVPVFTGCPGLPEQRFAITVTFPAVQPVFAGGGWQLAYRHRGEIRVVPVVLSGGAAELLLPAGTTAVTLSRPDFPGLCAGAVFPDQLDSHGCLPLSFEHGAAAEFLLGLSENDNIWQALNVPVFMSTWVEKGGGDPWSLDSSYIAFSLEEEMLGRSGFRRKLERPVQILFPAGVWYSSNPFAAPVIADNTAAPELCLYPGFFRFASADGTESVRFFLGETEDEDCIFPPLWTATGK